MAEHDSKTQALALITSHSDIMEIAKAAAQSRLFGTQDVAQAFSLMMLAHADGIHPMQAMRRYHVIQGRPSVKAEAMLSDFQLTGGRVEWEEHSATRCAGTFTHPQGGTIKVEWTIEDARKAGLAGKDNWKNYPKAMLHARVVADGVRWTYPQACQGFYTPEEIHDQTSAPAAPTPGTEANPINLNNPNDGRPLAERLADKLTPAAVEVTGEVAGEVADAEYVDVPDDPAPEATEPAQAEPAAAPQLDVKAMKLEIKQLVEQAGMPALKKILADLNVKKLDELDLPMLNVVIQAMTEVRDNQRAETGELL